MHRRTAILFLRSVSWLHASQDERNEHRPSSAFHTYPVSLHLCGRRFSTLRNDRSDIFSAISSRPWASGTTTGLFDIIDTALSTWIGMLKIYHLQLCSALTVSCISGIGQSMSVSRPFPLYAPIFREARKWDFSVPFLTRDLICIAFVIWPFLPISRCLWIDTNTFPFISGSLLHDICTTSCITFTSPNSRRNAAVFNRYTDGWKDVGFRLGPIFNRAPSPLETPLLSLGGLHKPCTLRKAIHTLNEDCHLSRPSSSDVRGEYGHSS